jgi:hypothetical protein
MVYLDTVFGFGLMYRGEPNAIVGFYFAKPETLLIRQLQGIQARILDNGKVVGRRSSRGLAPLDWERFLVSYVEEWALQNGFPEIAILSGKKNSWIIPDDKGEVHLPLEKAIQRYDGTARRLGYVQRRDNNWYKKLEVEEKIKY